MNIEICKSIVTDLLATIKKTGVLPWQRPWAVSKYCIDSLFPSNYISGHVYTGINTLVLLSKNRISSQWLTFKQANDIGGRIHKGEKGTQILFWKFTHKDQIDDTTGEITEHTIPYLKTYYVWNTEQIEIPADYTENRNARIAIALEKANKKTSITTSNGLTIDDIVTQTMTAYPVIRPTISHNGNIAAYDKAHDHIMLPPQTAFTLPEQYAQTLYHECIHSTAHESRLARKLGTSFGTETYAREELIAEIGAYFLLLHNQLAIPDTDKNTEAYLSGWYNYLKDNPDVFIIAGSQAQKAYTYLTSPLLPIPTTP